MTSPRPPRLRDTRSLTDRVRQDRINLKQLGVGMVDGRFPPARPLGSTSQFGDFSEGSSEVDTQEIAFINTDTAIAEGPGDTVVSLTYEPIPGSTHVYWRGLFVPTADWSRTGPNLTVRDPDALLRNGDLLSAVYAYYPSDVEVPEEPVSGILVPFEASGWKWKQVARSDATDYSATGYDDSAWSTAPAAFGDSNPAFSDVFNPWPEYTTVWDQNTRMWARRAVTTAAGDPLTISVRWNRDIVVYLNGVQIYAGSGSAGEHSVVVSGADVTGTDVLAVRVTDDNFNGTHTGCYFDAQVEQ
jgi:hypothetical protein